MNSFPHVFCPLPRLLFFFEVITRAQEQSRWHFFLFFLIDIPMARPWAEPLRPRTRPKSLWRGLGEPLIRPKTSNYILNNRKLRCTSSNKRNSSLINPQPSSISSLLPQTSTQIPRPFVLFACTVMHAKTRSRLWSCTDMCAQLCNELGRGNAIVR